VYILACSSHKGIICLQKTQCTSHMDYFYGTLRCFFCYFGTWQRKELCKTSFTMFGTHGKWWQNFHFWVAFNTDAAATLSEEWEKSQRCCGTQNDMTRWSDIWIIGARLLDCDGAAGNWVFLMLHIAYMLEDKLHLFLLCLRHYLTHSTSCSCCFFSKK